MVGRDVAPTAIAHVMASAKDTIYGFTMLREPFHAEELVRTKVGIIVSILCYVMCMLCYVYAMYALPISCFFCHIVLCYAILFYAS